MAENIKKVGGGISGWFSSLMGKPKSVAGAVTEDKAKPVLSNMDIAEKPPVVLEITDFSKEDSVKEDLKKFKALVGKYKSKVDEKVDPVTAAGVQKAVSAINASGSVADKPFYKKLVKVFFILFFLLILIFVAATLFNILKSKKITEAPVLPTPSPVPFEPTKPSVYASDESVLKLEEDIDLLEKELVRVSLRDNDLLPPKLDFDINFK
jgi:hypothetical protein